MTQAETITEIVKNLLKEIDIERVSALNLSLQTEIQKSKQESDGSISSDRLSNLDSLRDLVSRLVSRSNDVGV